MKRPSYSESHKSTTPGTWEYNISSKSFTCSEECLEIFRVPYTNRTDYNFFQECVYAEDKEMFAAEILKLKSSGKEGVFTVTSRIIRFCDRDLRWINVTGGLFFDKTGQPGKFIGTVVDITDKQVLEENNLEKLVSERTLRLQEKNEALKISEERYHRIIAEVEDYAIILLDANGIIQNWNKGAQKIKLYTAEEIIGTHFKIFYLPEDQAINLPQKLIDEAIHTGKAGHEGWRIRKDGTRFWGSISITALHDNQNSVIGFSKVTRDLTERKIAEDQLLSYAMELKSRNEELKESEERYHRMIGEVQDYAIILLDKDGIIQNWNAGAEKIKLYKENEAVGKHFSIFYLPEDKVTRLPERLIGEALNMGRATHEGWRIRKDGTRFWGSIVITALHDERGGQIGFSKVTRDLTERKAAEDKLLEYTIELEARNRELEQFAFVASHDLQEPLRKIQTFSDLVRSRIQDDEITKSYFSRIDKSAERMRALITATLNYSTLSKDDKEVTLVDLNQVLADVRMDMELIIDEKKAVIKSHDLPKIKGVQIHLSQVFANLLGNALKFSIADPVIEITYRIVKNDHIIDGHNGLLEDHYAEIVFSDNGIGFDPQFQEKIFSIFQRLHGKHEYEGTGIGLALCKRIMENHNGHIAAQSQLRKGAKFYLYFPLEN